MSLHRHVLSLGRGGIEPPTYCLSDSRSNQLSYHPIWLLCFISSVKFNSVLSNEIFCFFTTVKPSQILFVVLFVENIVSTHTKMAFYKINIILQSLSLVSPMFLEERQTFLTSFLVREVNIVLFGTCCTTKRNILFIASTHKSPSTGFEPWTYRLQGDCSNQLSYKGKLDHNKLFLSKT